MLEENESAEELPMVVWLRGDEPHFEAFTVDADEAMRRLGLKRSRLTQISGRELRVGRRRQGRYIKPYYRNDDIERYIEWVRPTASHDKSSRILFDAAEELAQKSTLVEKWFASEWKRSQTTLLESLKRELGRWQQVQKSEDREGQRFQTAKLSKLEFLTQELLQNFVSLQTKSQGIDEIQAGLSKTLAATEYHSVLLRRCEELWLADQDSLKSMAQLFESQQAQIQTLSKRLATLAAKPDPIVSQPASRERYIEYTQPESPVQSRGEYFVPRF